MTGLATSPAPRVVIIGPDPRLSGQAVRLLTRKDRVEPEDDGITNGEGSL